MRQEPTQFFKTPEQKKIRQSQIELSAGGKRVKEFVWEVQSYYCYPRAKFQNPSYGKFQNHRTTFENTPIFKSHSTKCWGLLLMEIPSVCLWFCDNFKPCDWSDCPKACPSLVENGSNVSE